MPGIDIKIDTKNLLEAIQAIRSMNKELDKGFAKGVATLKQGRTVASTPILISEPQAGISDESFRQRTSSVSEIAKQNRIIERSLRDLAQESHRSTWREHYRIGPPTLPESREEGDGRFPGSAGTGGGFLRNSLRTAGRMAGYAAAIGGGFSLFSLLHDSVNQTASYGAGEADLLMRGGNDRFRHNAKLQGYTPEEALAIQNAIGSRTGFQDKELNDASYQAAWYGRRMGMSGQSVSNYIGGTYAATGWSGDSISEGSVDKQLKYLRDTAVALGARGRIEEVLHNNQQIMTSIVQGRGGKELSATERMDTLAMQMALWGTSGQLGKGQSGANLLATMDQSIRGGGKTPGEKMFLAQALGVESVNSLEDIWEFNKRMNEGASKRNVKSVIDYSLKIAKQLGKSEKETKLFAMMNLRDALNLNENQTEKLLEANLQGIDSPDKALKAMQSTPEGRRRLKSADIDPFSLKGNQHRRTVARFNNTEIEVGEKLLPHVDALREGLNRGVDRFKEGDYLGALTESLKDNPLGWLMLASVGLNLGSNLLNKGPKPFPVPLPRGKGLPPLVPSPTTTGIFAGLNELRPKEANPSSYNEIDRMIGQGKPNAEIMSRAKELDSQPEKESGILGLTQSIRELVTELRVWLHQVNGDPISNPNNTRFRLNP